MVMVYYLEGVFFFSKLAVVMKYWIFCEILMQMISEVLEKVDWTPIHSKTTVVTSANRAK